MEGDGDCLPAALVLADTVVPAAAPVGAPAGPGTPSTPRRIKLSAPANLQDVVFVVERPEEGLQKLLKRHKADQAAVEAAVCSGGGCTLPAIYVPLPACTVLKAAPAECGWQAQGRLTFDLGAVDRSLQEDKYIGFVSQLQSLHSQLEGAPAVAHVAVRVLREAQKTWQGG